MKSICPQCGNDVEIYNEYCAGELCEDCQEYNDDHDTDFDDEDWEEKINV